MSARRTPSTTSLSKYARQNSPLLQNRSLDFCNAFWGLADGGVDVLFARMRGATRTMEELKNFWKERAAIEEDYSKRLAKLSKMVFGRDEIGELRTSLDTIRSETDRQATFHSNLAQQVRTELEGPVAAFHSRQLQHKKTYQVAIEKEFKAKQTQESYVNKAREKYEQDCIRINSFTAQASLVQGKDLEKINLKLERTQQTVQTNEREFANFAKALQDTVQRWEQDWKSFCDSSQDLEEQRIEFMKDNLWAYANAVSTVCVADDESCEKIRVALEQMEPEREMENFVHDYGTGSQIPDPPAFVNYQALDAIPSSSARPTFRSANFIRASTRESPIRQSGMFDEEPVVNTAGIGAGGGHHRPDPYGPEGGDLSRRNTQSVSHASHPPYTNGISGHHGNHSSGPSNPPASTPAPQSLITRRQSAIPTQQQQQLQRVLQDPYAETRDPTAETYIKVGSNAYKVDPMKDPQQTASSGIRSGSAAAASPTKTAVGTASDPLLKQLEELNNVVSTSGSVRKNTIIRPNPGAAPDPKPSHSTSPSIPNRQNTAGSSTLSPPGSAIARKSLNRSPSPGNRDYRNSAESVVGAHPSVSRSPSPKPPTAAFMVPNSAAQPSGSGVVHEVVSGYQQSLPGEHRSISRSNSRNRRGSVSASSAASHAALEQPPHGQHLSRPASIIGHAGVGAHGGSRSNSPQPTISRGPSPQPGQLIHMNNFIQPPAQTGPSIARAPSPNAVGIALDPSGRVLHDELAQRYQQQQQQPPPQPQSVLHDEIAQRYQQQQPPPQPQLMMHQGRMVPPQTQLPIYNPPPPPQQLSSPVQQQQQRRPNFLTSPTGSQPYTPVTPPPSGPTGIYHHHTPSPQPTYVQPQPGAVPPLAPLYNPPAPPQPLQFQPPPQQHQARYLQQQPPPQHQQQLPPQQQQQPPPPQHQVPSPQMNAYGSVNSMSDLQRANSIAYYGNQTPPQQVPAPPSSLSIPQMLGVQPPQQQRVIQQQLQQPPQPRGYQQPVQQPPHHHKHFIEPVQMRRSPSPQPPMQATEDGTPVLFYVRALYDYAATIDEEFDFQAGDIIAVTSTPEDGWWTGELLDEARRQKGRNVFPSNFVCLF